MMIQFVTLLYQLTFGQALSMGSTIYSIENYTSFQNVSIQQSTTNGTYYLKFLQQQNTGYIHIQVYVPRQASQTYQALLAYKQSVPPYWNAYQYLQADQADQNGYYLVKQYLHLVIACNSSAGYLSIITPKAISYYLSITYSATYPCAQNCNKNGVCTGASGCSCYSGWLDEDCSVPGINLNLNQEYTYQFTDASTQYFYYDNPQNNSVKTTFQTNSLLGIQLFVLYPNQTYLPTLLINNGAIIININSQQKQATLKSPKIIFAVTPVNLFQLSQNSDQFVIEITNNDEEYVSGGTSSTLIIIIVFVSVASCAVICTIVCLVRRCRQQRRRQYQEARRYMNPVQVVQVMQPQLVQQVSHNIYAGLRQLEYETALIGENCSICLEEFKNGDDLRQTQCHHHFHNKCIKDWLMMHETCPMCRVDLKHQIPIQQNVINY